MSKDYIWVFTLKVNFRIYIFKMSVTIKLSIKLITKADINNCFTPYIVYLIMTRSIAIVNIGGSRI